MRSKKKYLLKKKSDDKSKKKNHRMAVTLEDLIRYSTRRRDLDGKCVNLKMIRKVFDPMNLEIPIFYWTFRDALMKYLGRILDKYSSISSGLSLRQDISKQYLSRLRQITKESKDEHSLDTGYFVQKHIDYDVNYVNSSTNIE